MEENYQITRWLVGDRVAQIPENAYLGHSNIKIPPVTTRAFPACQPPGGLVGVEACIRSNGRHARSNLGATAAD